MKNWVWDGVGKDFRAQAEGVSGKAIEERSSWFRATGC
jgi:hypothetical protein